MSYILDEHLENLIQHSPDGTVAVLARELKEAREALRGIMPFVPLGFASTGRPGTSDGRDAALKAARAKAEALLPQQPEEPTR